MSIGVCISMSILVGEFMSCTKTNKFKVIQTDDKVFNVYRLHIYKTGIIFKKDEEVWEKATEPHILIDDCLTTVGPFKSMKEAKAWIDDTLRKEKTYPIETIYP